MKAKYFTKLRKKIDNVFYEKRIVILSSNIDYLNWDSLYKFRNGNGEDIPRGIIESLNVKTINDKKIKIFNGKINYYKKKLKL